MVDRELCVQAADRAVAYLRERVLDDTWVAAHRDIAYYFKAPQAFLLAENEHEYLGAARRLLAFLRSCDGINESLFAHKAAVAAAMGGERDAAGTISEYLLSQQRAHGGFADDADAMDTVDQTAELACWLRMLPELAAATEPVSWTVVGF